jgi:hypothetical protein
VIVEVETGHVVDFEGVVIVGVLIYVYIWPVGHAVFGGDDF